MARFVLVHGAFSGAWVWGPLAERLRESGHTVEVFDLPGHGNDQTPPGAVSLDLCVHRLVDTLNSQQEPALVAANSMGGIVATQAAARVPEHVAALVYIAAFVPADGQSLLDLSHLPEGANDQVQANIVITPPVATLPVDVSGSVLYNEAADDVASWAVKQLRPQPLGPLGTPVSIPSGALDGTSRYYMVCERDRAIPLALQRRMSEHCDMVIETDADHTPQLSRVEQTAAVLEQFAEHAAARGRSTPCTALHFDFTDYGSGPEYLLFFTFASPEPFYCAEPEIVSMEMGRVKGQA